MPVEEIKNFENSMDLERLYSVVALSADMIFEYLPNDEIFRFFKRDHLVFSEMMSLNNDFEQFFKENNVVFVDDIDTFERLCDNIRSGIDRANFEIRFRKNTDDEYYWYRIKMHTLRDEDGHFKKIIGKFENISDIKNAEMRLIDKAERDPLTRVYNKSTTKKLIKNYLRTDTKDTYDAFIIIDVDDFKKVNDTLGHLFGDSILADLSQEMQDLFRSNDVVGRIGGDEFIVFLRGMKQKSHIEGKANDICKIFDLLYSGDDGAKITGSLGIALFPQDGDTFDELYRKADLALYASKRAGKSCYTFYSAESEEASGMSLLPRVEQYSRNKNFLCANAEFDSYIINSAFEITEAGERENELYDILYKAGKHFNVSRISVYEYNEQLNRLEVREQWNSKFGSNTSCLSIPYTSRDAVAARAYFDDNNIFVADLKRDKLLPFERFLNEQDVKSCIACGRFADGKLRGFVCFEECVSPKPWSIEEAKTAIAVTKLAFSLYL